MKIKFLGLCFLPLTFWLMAFGQDQPPTTDPPVQLPAPIIPQSSPQPLPPKELVVRGAVMNPEVVGDEFSQIRLEVMILQGRRINWEVLKNPKNFEPFTLGNFSVTERGISLDPRFKNYNAFEVSFSLSLPDKPYGQYESAALSLEVIFTDFQYQDQAVQGKEKKKTVFLKGFKIAKVPLRAELDADKKSLEIGDQFIVTLKLVHDSETHLLNLRRPENVTDSENSTLFLDQVKLAGSETLGIKILETNQNTYRQETQVSYHLTSFEFPPQELTIGPFEILYQIKSVGKVQSYKTGELHLKLNSVLTQYSQWEKIRLPVFPDQWERWWLITVPRYGSLAVAVLLSVLLGGWLISYILAVRYQKTPEKVLPIQLLLQKTSSGPFFLRHWSYLWWHRRYLVKRGGQEMLENFIYHFRLCAGSVEGLSRDRALTLTAGQFKECSARSASVLDRLENCLFENSLVGFSEAELGLAINDLARIKLQRGWRRFFGRLSFWAKRTVRHS